MSVTFLLPLIFRTHSGMPGMFDCAARRLTTLVVFVRKIHPWHVTLDFGQTSTSREPLRPIAGRLIFLIGYDPKLHVGILDQMSVGRPTPVIGHVPKLHV